MSSSVSKSFQTIVPKHDLNLACLDHEVSLDNFRIVGREDQSIARTIKEAVLIRINDPSLNRKTATDMG